MSTHVTSCSARIVVYGKLDCGLCEKAKEKLKVLGLPFVFRIVDDSANWREDEEGYRSALAEYSFRDTLPIFSIGGQNMGYPEAMKILRASCQA